MLNYKLLFINYKWFIYIVEYHVAVRDPLLEEFTLDFPGGAVVKNLPANARDTGSIPGLVRSHMLRSN